MSDFDASQHPRGQAGNAGQFRVKSNDAPTATLDDAAADPIARAARAAAEPLTLDELMETYADGRDYGTAHIPVTQINDRLYQEVTGKPSERIDRERPAFTPEAERDFLVALGRIDVVWDHSAPLTVRSEALIADMRRSGAFGPGAEGAREAYARALHLNESGGFLDEERVNHLLDVLVQPGGGDYLTHARAFGYSPVQYAGDLLTAARAAAYRQAHPADPLTESAAMSRKTVLEYLARDAGNRLDRGWSTMDADAEQLRASVAAAEADITKSDHPEHRVHFTAVRDAYMFALSKIEGAGAE